MQTTSHRISLWHILIALAGVLAAVVVYTTTNDVVWTIVPLLLTTAVIRQLIRHDIKRS